MEIGRPYGLQDGDIESRGMGQNGVDIILSPAARKIFNLCIEAKNCETLNVNRTFVDHYKKYCDEENLKLLVHSRNHMKRDIDDDALVTMRFIDLVIIFATLVSHENTRKIGFHTRKV